MKSFKIICCAAAIVLCFLLGGTLNAQSQKVFRGNHFEYCCQTDDGTFSDCDDPDYSIPYVITVTNTKIKVSETFPDGKLNEFEYTIKSKVFSTEENVWYFEVVGEEGEENYVLMSRNGDFMMILDFDFGMCALVYYMHE